jgi:hypothetical protein
LGAGGVEVNTLTINVDTPVNLYSASYDVNSNFCNNTTTGTWTVTGFDPSDTYAQINTPNVASISFNPHIAPSSGTVVFTPSIITGDSTGTLTVNTGNATSFDVTATTSTATVGTPFTALNVVAKDQYGNVAINSYNGSKTLTVTGPSAGPENGAPTATVNATFTNGQATVLATGITFVKAETVKVTLTDNTVSYTPKPSGQSGNIVVSSNTATHYHIVSPTPVIAGTSFNITSITAHDIYGNVATGYSGNKTITYSGPAASPNNNNPSYTTAVDFTNGVSTTSLATILYKTETVKIHMIEGAISGDSNDITVQAGPTGLISLSSGDNQSGEVNSTLANPLVVLVKDIYGNLKNNQVVQFVVTAGNGSVGSASPVTNSSGLAQSTWTVGTVSGAINTVEARIDGVTGSPIIFTASATPTVASGLQVIAPPTATAGTSFSVTVNALDGLGNIDTSYAGTKTISFSGPGNGPTSGTPTYPATADFVSGSAIFNVTLVKSETIGLHMISGSLSGTSDLIEVSSSETTTFLIVAPSAVTVNVSFAITSIQTKDQFGNNTLDSGTKTLVYSGPSANAGTQPSYTTSVSFTNGSATTTLTTTLVKIELTAITVTEGSITGTSGSIQVTSSEDYYMVIDSGNNQSGIVGTQLSQPLVIVVYDKNGSKAVGKTVQFTPSAGTISTPSPSNSDGKVNVQWTLGTSVGTQTAIVSMVGISSTLSYTATATVGPPFKLAFTTSAKSIWVNIVSLPVTICLQDQYGNMAMPVNSDLTVTLDGTSTTKSFSNSSIGPWGITSVTIATGTYCKNFYYKNSEPGNYNMQISSASYQGDTQAISVVSNDLVLLEVEPASFTLRSNQTQQMIGRVYNQNHVEENNITILWSMQDETAGTISESGLFSPSQTSNIYLNAIKATVASLEAFADVTITDGTITVTPTSPSVSPTSEPGVTSTPAPGATVTPTPVSPTTVIVTVTPTVTPGPGTNTNTNTNTTTTVTNSSTNYSIVILNNYYLDQLPNTGDINIENPISITRSQFPVILSPKQGSFISGENVTISGTSRPNSLIVLNTPSRQVLGSGRSDYQGNWSIVLGADKVITDQIQVMASIHGTSMNSLPITFSIQQRDVWGQIRQYFIHTFNF